MILKAAQLFFEFVAGAVDFRAGGFTVTMIIVGRCARFAGGFLYDFCAGFIGKCRGSVILAENGLK